ncbi:MAG: molybdopterin molybdenumtransferase MoeA [Rhodobacteraceae bacterium]|nr:MAG: molybdopterin molybdenumtransferase MoeA [Paracoccaceae bacterium]
MVDWSAAAVPSPAKPSADAIWIAVARGAVVESPVYRRTRAGALAHLADLFAAEIAAGRRVLAGFDFNFGWPRGFAGAAFGAPRALTVWDWLSQTVEDAEDNRNNRFAVAEALNARLPGVGPFWGRPATALHPGVPEKGGARAGHGLPELRLVEERLSAARIGSPQPCWKLYTTGAAGSQALLGVAGLARLKRDPRLAGAVRVWPFETGLHAADAPVTLTEIYYALVDDAVKARPDGEVKDAAQTRLLARAVAALDADGALGPLFAGAPDLDAEARRLVADEEGWIFGAEAAADVAAAAFSKPPKLRNDCFALPRGVDWTPVDAALARLRETLTPVCEPETVPLAEADGRILAEPAVAVRAHPPAANAAVDGYAFAHASLGAGDVARLRLVDGRAAAGAPFRAAVPPGAALRILTGALVPEGADTVALEEDVEIDGRAVVLETGLKRGANVRRAGENLDEGAVAAPAGRRLGPADLAQIAAGGLGTVVARRRLRVAVLSTGDEVAEPGSAAGPAAVMDSNRPMLLAMLRRWGFAAVDLGCAPDAAAAVRAALDRGAAEADAILTSGGASAGDEDHVSRLLRETGALTVWRIAMKPGRPLALGLWRGAPVFGLPGNPVAAFVCALIFARPALMRLAGADWPEPRPLTVPAAFSKRKKAGRREWLRARLTPEGAAEVFRSEGSGLIGGLVWADGLVALPDAAVEIAPGDPVAFLPYAAFGL